MLFAADFNSLPPAVWCPTDSANTIASITTLRIWDSQEKWSDVQISSTNFDWSKMDNTLNNLVTNHNCPMAVIYTVGSTPQWASVCAGNGDPSTCLPGPTTSGFGGGVQCAGPTDYSCTPPSDVGPNGTGSDAQFQNYISQVVTRYKGQIAYYEVWNEADSPNFWCPDQGSPASCTGSLPNMVRMGWDLYNIVHCADPNAKVLSPSFHGDTTTSWMSPYVNTSINAPAGSIGSCSWPAKNGVTGKMTFDITNFHGRPGGNSNVDPTLFFGIYDNVLAEVNADGLPTALFDDENGYLAEQFSLTPDSQAGYVAISYVIRASVGSTTARPYPILLSSWYSWNSPLQQLQGSIGGLAYDVVAAWLSGSKLSSCTIAGGTLYSCPGTSKAGTPFTIMWDMSQNCNSGCTTLNQPAGSFATWTDLTGTQHSISVGSVPVGYKPILLE
jgi:hypothetical protein